MRISIFGLGYVGCVSIGCLAKNGHTVVGVDVQEQKVELINNGIPTIVEKDIDEIIRTEHAAGKISATTDYLKAVTTTETSIICVGTPSSETGQLNLDYLFRTAEQIGEAIAKKNEFHTVVIRSTVMPGTNEKVAAIIAEHSGKKKNEAFAVVSNPEFLREGSAVSDYYNPAITVIGSDHQPSIEKISSLYKDIKGEIITTEIKVAELIKYVNNSFHALKITFANEVGNICKALNIDSHPLMELFCKDTHLNISPAYFKPGFAYGGSCLPKDLKGLATLAHDHYLTSPLLQSIHHSNEHQKQIAFDMIAKTGKKKICFIGLSFKEGTDDLRYSPSVDLAEKLIGKGYTLSIYDKNVHLSKLVGANKAFINHHLPHLSELVCEHPETAICQSDVVLINHRNFDLAAHKELLKDKIVIDLVRIKSDVSALNYQGICW
ncbi:MAG: nucleotide sugar dehydrogenase [Chitinophagaceae bacterium]